MKKTITAFALCMAASGPALADSGENVFTVVTAAEPQTQLMAMVLTMNAVEQGATGRILLCGPAGDIALQDAPETATAGQPPRDASPQGLMKMMMERHDVKVEVCAIYLPGRGDDASVLLEGVTPAAPDEVARALMDDDTVVLSF
ncbi:MAG: DsrE family protein [Paracoccus sp. (in: a-proteobacteria)]|nr:DsrE family protein [Paracoccus sp. (in: a-proteobacteria)]